MKIGYYRESPADSSSHGNLRGGNSRRRGATDSTLDLEAHSVPGFFSALNSVFRGVHYNSDADGLVIVVDADHTELHDPSHDTNTAKDCRYCQASNIIQRARTQLQPRIGRPELKVAIGVTLPSIRSWVIVWQIDEVGEAAWKTSLASGKRLFTSQNLKKWCTARIAPRSNWRRNVRSRETLRIRENLKSIEDAFPIGFGLLAQEIRSWS